MNNIISCCFFLVFSLNAYGMRFAHKSVTCQQVEFKQNQPLFSSNFSDNKLYSTIKHSAEFRLNTGQVLKDPSRTDWTGYHDNHKVLASIEHLGKAINTKDISIKTARLLLVSEALRRKDEQAVKDLLAPLLAYPELLAESLVNDWLLSQPILGANQFEPFEELVPYLNICQHNNVLFKKIFKELLLALERTQNKIFKEAGSWLIQKKEEQEESESCFRKQERDSSFQEAIGQHLPKKSLFYKKKLESIEHIAYNLSKIYVKSCRYLTPKDLASEHMLEAYEIALRIAKINRLINL